MAGMGMTQIVAGSTQGWVYWVRSYRDGLGRSDGCEGQGLGLVWVLIKEAKYMPTFCRTVWVSLSQFGVFRIRLSDFTALILPDLTKASSLASPLLTYSLQVSLRLFYADRTIP